MPSDVDFQEPYVSPKEELPELKPSEKKPRVSKGGIVKGVFEAVSATALIAAEEVVRSTTDLVPQGLDLIVQQFEQSGAELIYTSETGITNFYFGAEDVYWDPELGDFALNRPMDFSGVPQLYVNDGNAGFYTLLTFAIAGTGAQLILGKKFDNQYLKGGITTVRRIGEGIGLGKLIASAEGLKNMPTILDNNITDYSSNPAVSTVDIGPIVQAGQAALNKMRNYGLITILTAEGITEGVELYKYFKKNRAGTGSLEIKDFDRNHKRTSYQPK